MISSLTINKSIYTKGRVSIISDLNMTLPAALVAISRYLAPAPGLRKTSCTSLLLSIDGTDGRTDRRITCRFMDAHRWNRATPKSKENAYATTVTKSAGAN